MNEWINKEVKIDLDNKMYYRGLVLSFGKDYVVIRDINSKQVYIRLDRIVSMKEISK